MRSRKDTSGFANVIVGCLLIAVALALVLTPVFAQINNGEPPSLKTELSEKGVSLKPIVMSPTRGLVTNITDIGRSEQNAAVLDNLQMLKGGVWTSRGIGHTKFRSTGIGGLTQLRSIYPYTDPDGDSGLLLEANGEIYHLDPSAPNGTLTDLGTIAAGANIGNLATFCNFSDEEIIVTNGDTDEPYIWNGDLSDDFEPSAHWPVTIDSIDYNKPKFVESFAGRAAFAGMDRPYTVLLSEYERPDRFQVSGTPLATDAGALTFPSNLGRITGLKKLRLDSSNEEVLLVGFERGFGMITGSSALDFSLVVLTNEFGLLSNRTWAQLGNEMFFLATDGIRKFSTASGISALSNASVSFGIQDLFSRIRKVRAPLSFVVRHPSTQELIFWIAIDNDEMCKNGIVLNYNTSGNPSATIGSSISNPIFSTRSGANFSGGADADGRVYYGDYSAGYLFQGYSGNTYDGANYSWSYLSPLIGGNTPIQNCSMRRVDVLTDGPEQSFTINAYTLSQNAGGSTSFVPQGSRSYSVTTSSITDLSTWTSGNTTSYPKFLEYQPIGSGRFWSFKISGTGGQHINFAGLNAVLTLGGWKQ